MGIYRGPGGSTDATRDATSEAVITIQAKDTAVAAATTAQAAASAATVEAANAATSATSAATSLASIGGSLASAEAARDAALVAETNAETAETNAETAQAAAELAETNAETAATNAQAYELSANNWATKTDGAVAGGEFSAKYNANLAATSATNASNSASAASTSASNASSSASAAATSATNAAAVYDEFDDRYLGAKASAPSVDNDGNPLQVGALYYNTTGTPQLFVWTGSAWDQAAFSVSGAVTSFNSRTGAVTLSSGDVTSALTYTPVDKATANTFTATQTFGTVVATTATLTNGTVSTAPSASTDLVNKTYVDTAVGAATAGIHFHTPVRVESPTNLPATYSNGTAGVGATLTNSGTQAALVIDGITLSVNDRVLMYTQTNAAHNGVYTVTDVGSGSTNWVLTRATDADTFGEGSNLSLDQGSYFFVTEGNTGAGESYVCTTEGTITFGTTNINFTQFSATKEYLAGTGLTLNNATFSITNTGTAGTYGSASTVPVLTTNAQGQVTGVTNTTIAIASGAVSGLAASATTDTTNASNISSGVLATTYGGTGITALGTGVATALGQNVNGSGAISLSTSPTLVTATVTGLKETRVAMGASNIDLAAGNYFTRTISGATTLTVSNVASSGTSNTFILDLTNGGAGAITWFSGVKWVAGTAPTLTAAGRDALGFFTHDAGTTWTGLVLGLDIK